MYIASVLGIVASIYTLLPLFNDTFIKDGVLLEIKKEDSPILNIEGFKTKILTDSGEDVSKLIRLKLTFWNKGDEVLKESRFSKSNPFKINLNDNILIKNEIKFMQGNSLINERQVIYNKTENTINFLPFTLESNRKFSISFMTLKKEKYEITIDGQIENIPLEFGDKEKKINKFLSEPYTIVLILIVIVAIPLLLTIYLSELISKHFLQSKIYFIIQKKHKTNSETLKTYIDNVLNGNYSMRIFAKEYIDFLIDNKINLYTKDLTNMFITHKYLFDNIDNLSLKYSNFYDSAYSSEIFDPNKKEPVIDKDIDKFLDEVCNLSIYDKVINMFYYLYKYFSITNEDKELLMNSKKSFLGYKS